MRRSTAIDGTRFGGQAQSPEPFSEYRTWQKRLFDTMLSIPCSPTRGHGSAPGVHGSTPVAP